MPDVWYNCARLEGWEKPVKRLAKMLFLVVVSLGLADASGSGGLSAQGTFVQKKFLHDVGVTLTSTGTWSFEKDVSFVWRTVKPVPSVFEATPTNYTFSAGGRTTSRRLAIKIEDLAQIFEIKEMKEFVEKVEADRTNPVFASGDMAIPSSLRVLFRNGDRLDISLSK